MPSNETIAKVAQDIKTNSVRDGNCIVFKSKAKHPKKRLDGKLYSIQRIIMMSQKLDVAWHDYSVTITCKNLKCIENEHLQIDFKDQTLSEKIRLFEQRCEDVDSCLLAAAERPTIQWQGECWRARPFLRKFYDPTFSEKGLIETLICGNKRCVRQAHYDYRIRGKLTKDELWSHIKNLKATQKDTCLVVDEIAKDRSGYGFLYFNGILHRLHRLVYWIHSDKENIGDLNDGEKTSVAHLCRNKTCINKDHYALKTHKENMADKIIDNTHNRGENSHNARLTAKDAQEIADLSVVLSARERAKQFGVSISTINDIDRRRSWQCIQHPNNKAWIGTTKKAAKQKFRSFNGDEVLGIRQKLDANVIEHISNPFTQTPCKVFHNKSKKVYPTMSLYGIQALVHHWAMIVGRNGQIWDREQYVVRHLCNNVLCCNSDHMALGSRSDNMLDKRIHGTASKKVTIRIVQDIRSSVQTVQELATRYNLTEPHIKSILKNRSWKDL